MARNSFGDTDVERRMSLQSLMTGGQKGGGYAYTNKKGKTIFSATDAGINTQDYKRDKNTFTGSNAPDGGKGGWTIAGYNQFSSYNAKGGGSVNRSVPIWKRTGNSGAQGQGKAKGPATHASANPNPAPAPGPGSGSAAAVNDKLTEARARVDAWDNYNRGTGPDPGASMPRSQSDLPAVMRSSPHLRSSGEGASNLYAGIFEEGGRRIDNSNRLAQEYSDRTALTREESQDRLATRIRDYQGQIPDYDDPFAQGSYRDGKRKSIFEYLEGKIG